MAANQSTEDADRNDLSLVHPGDAAFQTVVHRRGVEMDRPSVAGQHPFEAVVEQAFHRSDLLLPRIPAGAAKRVKMAALLAPGEVIAGEKVRIVVKENGVPFRVAGRRNHQHAAAEIDRILSRGLKLDRRRTRMNIIAMQYALAAETRRETGVIGNVVLMREQHPRRTAHRCDVLHQRPRKAWRVDQDVPLRTLNEIADGAEGRLGGIAATVDVAIDPLRQRRQRRTHVVLLDRANGRGRTRDQRLLRREELSVSLWLMKHRRLIAGIAEDAWRKN